jgi:hypothetical protein
MNKRQFLTKALLGSLPVAADMLHATPDDAAAENVHERIASFAGKIAEELTLVLETQMVISMKSLGEPANQTDPDRVASRRNVVNVIESGGEN